MSTYEWRQIESEWYASEFWAFFGNVNKLHVTLICVPGFLLIAVGQHVPRWQNSVREQDSFLAQDLMTTGLPPGQAKTTKLQIDRVKIEEIF